MLLRENIMAGQLEVGKVPIDVSEGLVCAIQGYTRRTRIDDTIVFMACNGRKSHGVLMGP